mmetsp:Transcript_69658/g.193869  ORF Transcript_69658/g.193869 Transcript_69658/m.193869 type:complete len:294 (+) Transcript_69658:674-1555(+)
MCPVMLRRDTGDRKGNCCDIPSGVRKWRRGSLLLPPRFPKPMSAPGCGTGCLEKGIEAPRREHALPGGRDMVYPKSRGSCDRLPNKTVAVAWGLPLPPRFGLPRSSLRGLPSPPPLRVPTLKPFGLERLRRMSAEPTPQLDPPRSSLEEKTGTPPPPCGVVGTWWLPNDDDAAWAICRWTSSCLSATRSFSRLKRTFRLKLFLKECSTWLTFLSSSSVISCERAPAVGFGEASGITATTVRPSAKRRAFRKRWLTKALDGADAPTANRSCHTSPRKKGSGMTRAAQRWRNARA